MPKIARIFSLLLLSLSPLRLLASLPELSSIEPIEFDEASQRLVARGDARLEYGDMRITADRITYFQDYKLADATGNIVISREGNRLLAERLNYEIEEGVFSIESLRSGQWPYYLSAVSAGGTQSQMSLTDGTLYYGEPGKWTLSVTADTLEYKEDEDSPSVRFEKAVFRIGSIPIFYVPGFTYYIDEAPYYLEVSGGYDGELGAHLQTTTLFPVTPWLRLGANFDLYSKRGVLAGPTVQYIYDSASQSIRGALSTGYIDDQGDTGEDIFGDPIREERGFAQWRHKHNIGERFSTTASMAYWSDSEVTRDFREDYYRDDRYPDNFFEAVYSGNNYFLSAFTRFAPNDFDPTAERLPEVRFDLLPIPIFQTGAYTRASASYARVHEDLSEFFTGFEENQYDLFEGSVRMERPILIQEWLTLTPLVGARLDHYTNQEVAFGSLPEDEFSQEIYEIGFDLIGRMHATYPTINRTWGIDGLRHLVRPVIRYRYFSDPDSDGEIASIDRESFSLERPILDLSDIRAIDSQTERHLARLGVENLFQTRAEDYGSRTMAALNLYQDIIFEKNTRFDGDEEDTFDATWVELALSPAPWVKFDLAARFKTESLSLEELRTRTRLISGEIWEIGLSTDLLDDRVNQYRLDYLYRINERYALLAEVRYDVESGDFTEVGLGWRSRVGSTWEIFYAVTLREAARRESDVELTVRMRLADPNN